LRLPPRSPPFPYTTLFRSTNKTKNRMKSFFKSVLATLVGIIIAFFLIVIITLGIMGAWVSSISDKTVEISDNTVLHISLNYPIRSEEHTSELQSRENLVCR